MNEQITVLIQNLQRACDSQNWELLEQLDGQIRQALPEIIASASSAQEKELLALELKSIQKIYDLVIQGSRKNQTEIAKELKKITKDRNAANSYLGVSQF